MKTPSSFFPSHCTRLAQPLDRPGATRHHHQADLTEETVSGEVSGDLPGSKSVAREERAVRKLGSPAASRRTNCGGQSGQEVQRQEDLPTGVAIYETDFLDCSYGYRPGRNPLQAVRALTDALQRGQFEFIVEAHFEL